MKLYFLVADYRLLCSLHSSDWGRFQGRSLDKEFSRSRYLASAKLKSVITRKVRRIVTRDVDESSNCLVTECPACHAAVRKAVHKMPRVVAIISFFAEKYNRKHIANVAFGAVRRQYICENICENWRWTFLAACRDTYHLKRKVFLKNIFQAVVRVSKRMFVMSGYMYTLYFVDRM